MHAIPLSNALINIIINPLRAHRVHDTPEEPPVRPPLEVELLIRQVLDNLKVVAHQSPSPLHRVLWQVLPNSAALPHLISGESLFLVLENQLEEAHAGILGLGQPDIH